MLQFISETILDEMYDAGLSLEGASGYHKSLEDIILDGIEKSGMIPPGKCDLEEVSPSVAYYYYYGTDSGWEKEDDD